MNLKYHQVPGNIYELHCLFVKNYSQRHTITYQQVKRDFQQHHYPANESMELNLENLFPFLQKYLVGMPDRLIHLLIYYYDIYENHLLSYFQFYEMISNPELLLLKNCERIDRYLEAKSFVERSSRRSAYEVGKESKSENTSKPKPQRGSSRSISPMTRKQQGRSTDMVALKERKSRSPQRTSSERQISSPERSSKIKSEISPRSPGNKENERRPSWSEHTISSQLKVAQSIHSPRAVTPSTGDKTSNTLLLTEKNSKNIPIKLYIKEIWQACSSPYGIETIEEFETRRRIPGFRDAVNQLLDFLRPPRVAATTLKNKPKEIPKVFTPINVLCNSDPLPGDFKTSIEIVTSKTLHDVYVMSILVTPHNDEPPVFDRTFLLATQPLLIKNEGEPLSDLPLPYVPSHLNLASSISSSFEFKKQTY